MTHKPGNLTVTFKALVLALKSPAQRKASGLRKASSSHKYLGGACHPPSKPRGVSLVHILLNFAYQHTHTLFPLEATLRSHMTFNPSPVTLRHLPYSGSSLYYTEFKVFLEAFLECLPVQSTHTSHLPSNHKTAQDHVLLLRGHGRAPPRHLSWG